MLMPSSNCARSNHPEASNEELAQVTGAKVPARRSAKAGPPFPPPCGQALHCDPAGAATSPSPVFQERCVELARVGRSLPWLAHLVAPDPDHRLGRFLPGRQFWRRKRHDCLRMSAFRLLPSGCLEVAPLLADPEAQSETACPSMTLRCAGTVNCSGRDSRSTPKPVVYIRASMWKRITL